MPVSLIAPGMHPGMSHHPGHSISSGSSYTGRSMSPRSHPGYSISPPGSHPSHHSISPRSNSISPRSHPSGPSSIAPARPHIASQGAEYSGGALLEVLARRERERQWRREEEQRRRDQRTISEWLFGQDQPSSDITTQHNTVSGSTVRTDNIPTAHVIPHPTPRSSSTSSYTPHQQHPHSALRNTTDNTISGLRRAVSTNDFTDIGGYRSASPPTVDNYQKAGGPGSINGHQRRWSSYQDLDKTSQNFQELAIDTDPTLSESRFIAADDLHNGYASGTKAHHSPSVVTGTSGTVTGATPVAVSTANSMQYSGYMSVGKDHYAGVHPQTGRTLVTSTADELRHTGSELRHVGAAATYGQDRLMNYSNYNGTAGNYNGMTGPRGHNPSGGGAFNVTPVAAPPAHLAATGGSYGNHGRPSGSDVHHDNFGSDITSWQRQHQEQLRRQHYEATQPTTSFQPSLSNGGTPVSGMTSFLDPHKLDAVKHAADSIIREKDNIIEKQKVKILHLENQNKESQSDLHKAMYQKAQEESDTLHFKLQEVQYECASLKAQLTEVMSSRGSGVVDLERQLGKTEYELREVKIDHEKDREKRISEMKTMQEMLSTKDKLVSEWKEKYMTQKSENEALERKMESLDRYLNDLPTADDHSKKNNEVRQLRDEKAKYKSRCVELERRVEAANKTTRHTQDQLTEAEQTAGNQRQQIDRLQTEISRLKEELGLGEGEEAPLGLREELEQVRQENQRLAADLEKARKLLEAKHKKQQAIEMKHRGDTKTLEERLSQEENTVAGLRDELLNKDQHLKKLRASVKDLGGKNQDLLERNMSLEEAQRHLEGQLTGEAHKLEQRLLKEMAVCFAELQSLVQICVQRAEGQDPNISALLGVKSVINIDPDDAQPVGDNVQSLKYKVSKIHDLRKDIDNLREIVSNKYAEDMGENLNCTTQ